jgi:hypothetical protein
MFDVTFEKPKCLKDQKMQSQRDISLLKKVGVQFYKLLLPSFAVNAFITQK